MALLNKQEPMRAPSEGIPVPVAAPVSKTEESPPTVSRVATPAG